MISIGFVIISHNHPNQLHRLVRRLAASFPNSPIACHHDVFRCPIDVAAFPSSVWFLEPATKTFWGHISIVEAELRALQLLYERADPDWFVILSGSDYPVTSAEQILQDFLSAGVDAFLDYRKISPDSDKGSNHGDPVHGDSTWTDYARRRYLETMIAPDIAAKVLSAKSLAEADRLLNANRGVMVVPSSRALPTGIECFAGDHWLTGNRRVAHRLIKENTESSQIMKYFAACLVPDEAFYQTVLCNTPTLRICPTSKRYAEWTSSSIHPKFLEHRDLRSIVASGAHFARKFQEDHPLLGVFDEIADTHSVR